MTIAFALEYIPRRMHALGIGVDYYILLRHFVIKGEQTIEIDAQNQFFIQIDKATDVRVLSDFGVYDLNDTNIAENDYEHQGKIIIRNYSSGIKHIRFIQIVPFNK